MLFLATVEVGVESRRIRFEASPFCNYGYLTCRCMNLHAHPELRNSPGFCFLCLYMLPDLPGSTSDPKPYNIIIITVVTSITITTSTVTILLVLLLLLP